MDFYEKERDVTIVKKQDRLTLDGSLNQFQTKEYVANPKIIIDQRTRKIKPLLRKKLTQTFLSRVETLEEKKLQETNKQIQIAFDKTKNLDDVEALIQFRDEITSNPVDLRELGLQAAIEGKQRYKDKRVASQLEHIRLTLKDVRMEVKESIAELGYLDFLSVFRCAAACSLSPPMPLL